MKFLNKNLVFCLEILVLILLLLSTFFEEIRIYSFFALVIIGVIVGIFFGKTLVKTKNVNWEMLSSIVLFALIIWIAFAQTL